MTRPPHELEDRSLLTALREKAAPDAYQGYVVHFARNIIAAELRNHSSHEDRLHPRPRAVGQAMKKSLFDDLARDLATPIPRRRALRTIGAAFAIGVVRAIIPGRALADSGRGLGCAGHVCGPGVDQKFCCVQMPGPYDSWHSTGCCGGPGREDCCIGSNGDDANGLPYRPMTWCCPSGTCSGSIMDGRAPGKAGGCVGKACTSDETQCGKACCKPGEYCASPRLNKCCTNGDSICAAYSAGTATCCKPGTKCCFTASRTACCDVNTETCSNGTCKCKAPATKCGTQCCAKGEPCCQTAGGGMCCKKGEFCATIAGAPGNKNCCPSSRIVVTASGVPVCCPTGTVETTGGVCCPASNPNCCIVAANPSDPRSGTMAVLCAKGTICSLGACVPFL